MPCIEYPPNLSWNSHLTLVRIVENMGTSKACVLTNSITSKSTISILMETTYWQIHLSFHSFIHQSNYFTCTTLSHVQNTKDIYVSLMLLKQNYIDDRFRGEPIHFTFTYPLLFITLYLTNGTTICMYISCFHLVFHLVFVDGCL